MIETLLHRRDLRPFWARSFAALFGAGAVVVGATIALPHPRDRVLLGLLLPIAAALALSAALLVLGDGLPRRFFFALPPFGSLLVAIVSLSAGSGARVAYAGFFFWSIASAFYFFPRGVAAVNVPLAAALYAVVLITGGEHFQAIEYFVPMAAVTVTALLIDRLNHERAQLRAELDMTIEGLDSLARTDGLTGLANRRELERNLDRELARAARTSSPTSLLMIDLDHFKEYNDVNGHLAGDRLLRAAAEAWNARLRASDLLVRFGGEEFVVVLPDCSLADAYELAERLRCALPDQQTCSVGAAAWDFKEDGDELIRRADQALLAAKRAGRNRVRTADVSGLAGKPIAATAM